jgi:hypothetical protein
MSILIYPISNVKIPSVFLTVGCVPILFSDGVNVVIMCVVRTSIPYMGMTHATSPKISTILLAFSNGSAGVIRTESECYWNDVAPSILSTSSCQSKGRLTIVHHASGAGKDIFEGSLDGEAASRPDLGCRGWKFEETPWQMAAEQAGRLYHDYYLLA